MLFSPTQQHPIVQKVTVFTLVEGLYDGAEFHDRDRIQSSTFPELQLTVEQVLTGE
ncbi:MAG: hypothetical protein NW224_01750 [Leptolyngbyaceae cyanobacterium bins.302]|nr:hypothetical protein [Leptolyngbyaceae cyanobacterium bins.302]